MFPEKLVNLRKEKGLSQEELAQKLHVVRQTISKWEKGHSMPDAQLLLNLANILEISVEELLKGEKDMTNETIDEHDEEQQAFKNEVLEQLKLMNENMEKKNQFYHFVQEMIKLILAGFVLWWVFWLMIAGISWLSMSNTETLTHNIYYEVQEIQDTYFHEP